MISDKKERLLSLITYHSSLITHHLCSSSFTPRPTSGASARATRTTSSCSTSPRPAAWTGSDGEQPPEGLQPLRGRREGRRPRRLGRDGRRACRRRGQPHGGRDRPRHALGRAMTREATAVCDPDAPLVECLRNATDYANFAIHRRSQEDPRCSGMGATLTAAAVARRRRQPPSGRRQPRLRHPRRPDQARHQRPVARPAARRRRPDQRAGGRDAHVPQRHPPGARRAARVARR